MKVVMTFEFSDKDREALVAYFRSRSKRKGLPKLATREICREFVEQAITNQWMAVADQEAADEEYRQQHKTARCE